MEGPLANCIRSNVLIRNITLRDIKLDFDDTSYLIITNSNFEFDSINVGDLYSNYEGLLLLNCQQTNNITIRNFVLNGTNMGLSGYTIAGEMRIENA